MIDGPPAPPKTLTFQIFWSDNDRPVGMYEHVTGSGRQDNILSLDRAGMSWLINLDQTRLVIIEPS